VKRVKYASLKESLLDTLVGMPLSWFISYLILFGSLKMNIESLVLISSLQTIVLTIVAIIRKLIIREKFKAMGCE
tara:strand:+ start:4151 stop:4375 length:225 start_codon:yes stop_codon:yes gene_type:complete